MKVARYLQNWMFGYGSPVTMGLMRILVGGLATVGLLMLAPYFEQWFTEIGFTPFWFAERWSGGEPRFSLLWGVTDPRITATVFGLTLVAAIFTAIGLFSRVASIALFIGVVSLHHRTPDILHSGDTLLRALVLYVACMPSGRALSVDRWWAMRRGRAPEVPLEASMWPQRLVQIQLAIVYLSTVWHKMIGSTWRDGTATWYPAQMSEFDRFPVPAFFDQQPFLWLTTMGTLGIEVALGTLVFWRPARKWVLLSGLLLHASIEYRFNIPLFAAIICSAYVSHYEGDEVSRWLRQMRDRLARFRRSTPEPSAGSV